MELDQNKSLEDKERPRLGGLSTQVFPFPIINIRNKEPR